MKKFILVISILSVFVAACNQKDQSKRQATPKSEAVKVKVVGAELVQQDKKLSYSGMVEAMQTIPLSFETTGTVEAVYVDEGDKVSAGQLLAKVERGSLESAHNGALAQYQQAVDAQVRLKSVYEKGSLPEIKWVEINSKLGQAKAMLEVAERNLENCNLISPTNGIIGQRNIEPGMSAIQVQAPLLIVKIEEVLVKISVPENEIGLLSKGMEAAITVGALANRNYSGTIERVGVVANVLSRTYSVKIKVENPDLLLKPGMVCEVLVNIPESKEKLLVPVTSVGKDAGQQNFVFLVDKTTGRAVRKNVVIDNFSDERIIIRSGLQNGDLVVLAGNHKISEGTLLIY